jgi:dTDP-4-amino-4,6-dideoxy-D-galactose acyltransferase
MKTDHVCSYLDWDSDFFKHRIARVNSRRLNGEILSSVLSWSEENSIDCLYFLADAADRESAVQATDNGFRFVDIRTTFERPLRGEKIPGASSAPEIRLSVPEDVPILRALAGVSHRDSRFYFDPSFSEAECNALYETWIEKSCQGYADAVLVAELAGRAVGYISLHLNEDGTGQIGLIAVSAEARGHGLGKKLINESLRWFASHGASSVRVVTQGRNVIAQRLYQSFGFLVTSVEVWYHRWFPERGRKT